MSGSCDGGAPATVPTIVELGRPRRRDLVGEQDGVAALRVAPQHDLVAGAGRRAAARPGRCRASPRPSLSPTTYGCRPGVPEALVVGGDDDHAPLEERRRARPTAAGGVDGSARRRRRGRSCRGPTTAPAGPRPALRPRGRRSPGHGDRARRRSDSDRYSTRTSRPRPRRRRVELLDGRAPRRARRAARGRAPRVEVAASAAASTTVTSVDDASDVVPSSTGLARSRRDRPSSSPHAAAEQHDGEERGRGRTSRLPTRPAARRRRGRRPG